VVTVCLADVVAVPVEWLWPDRVPLGKLTLLAGEAKLGKSFLTMDFIARVSAGLEIPCGGGECMPRGSVVLLSAEDDLADTIKPRLIACGADFEKVHALTTIRMPNGRFGPFNLSYVPHLERAILRAGDCRLVVIDPVPHYVGNGTDDHKNAQTPPAPGAPQGPGEPAPVAVLMVTHLNKGNGTKALNRVTGSGAYTALARSNWLVVKDKDDPKRRLFLSAGTNLVEEPSGLAYRIDRETRAGRLGGQARS
jgi:putative DNA primase/helicase